MAKYDFKLAIRIVNELDKKGLIVSASLGMEEDWFWSAEEIWNKNDQYQRDLPDNADELFEQYMKERKEYGSILDERLCKYDNILIGGIYESSWATPVLQVEFEDGSTSKFNCYSGQTADDITRIEKSLMFTSECLSNPVQNHRDNTDILNYK